MPHPFLLWIWSWFFTDRKIQFAILSVLTLTLLWSMFVEIPKLLKRIKFLTISVHAHPEQEQPWTNVRGTISNNCRRPIHLRGGYFVTFEDKKSSDRNYYDEYVVEEGEEFEFTADQTGFATPIEKIKKVVLFDSVRKKYTGYLYKGEFRNMLVAKALLLRDKWLK